MGLHIVPWILPWIFFSPIFFFKFNHFSTRSMHGYKFSDIFFTITQKVTKIFDSSLWHMKACKFSCNLKKTMMICDAILPDKNSSFFFRLHEKRQSYRHLAYDTIKSRILAFICHSLKSNIFVSFCVIIKIKLHGYKFSENLVAKWLNQSLEMKNTHIW